MVLPLALLLVLALCAVVLSMVSLAYTERLIERGALEYLERRMREEASLRAPGAPSSGAATTLRPLGFGFVLVEAGAGATRSMAVHWAPDVDSIARLLPGALEVGKGAGTAEWMPGVEPFGECPSPVGWPLVRVRDDAGGPAPDPPVGAPPRVGPIAIERLARLPGVESVSGPSLSGGTDGGLFVAVDDTSIEDGHVTGVLLSEGALDITGHARIRGLLMVRGELRLGGEARVEGVVLAGGSVSLEDGARLLGCPSIAAEALRGVLPEGRIALPGGNHLGRF